MKDDYIYYQFSLPHLIYVSCLKGGENILFELGSERVKRHLTLDKQSATNLESPVKEKLHLAQSPVQDVRRHLLHLQFVEGVGVAQLAAPAILLLSGLYSSVQLQMDERPH